MKHRPYLLLAVLALAVVLASGCEKKPAELPKTEGARAQEGWKLKTEEKKAEGQAVPAPGRSALDAAAQPQSGHAPDGQGAPKAEAPGEVPAAPPAPEPSNSFGIKQQPPPPVASPNSPAPPAGPQAPPAEPGR